jgi:hypothetical protein
MMMMKSWCCVQVPMVDSGQERSTTRKRKNASGVEVVSWVIEVVYLEILPNHLEDQFLRPVLVFVRVFDFWLQKGVKSNIEQLQVSFFFLKNPMKLTAFFPLAFQSLFHLLNYPHELTIP